jgi:thiamine biosynthesis protein ThiS
MQLIVNGRPQEIPAPATVKDLLHHIGFGERPVVVEHNHEALLPREHATRQLQAGDKLEVVQITAGG